MSTNYQASPDWRSIAWPGWLLLIGMAISLGPPATAHDLFAKYVQHSLSLSVGDRYTDLELDLTFFEEWSARERAAMDADANGRITRSEVEAYVKQLAPELARQVSLRVAGHELALAPLYAPEVDLLGNNQVGPAHHRLRLFFFAPTPTALRAKDDILIEDRLWPTARGLGTLQAEGRNDCVLETERARDPGFAPVRPGEARLFKAQCLKPPKAKSDVPAPR
jgi:hypothetical protein